ncbi:MAG: hypothetical protein IKO32_10370 [Lachnospiraceae bacterium]|nr:hypothetical protein [Lachnospiraceae bacterium]
MGKKATCIWAYITWVGFIIAMCQSCKDECKFHLNQALVLNILLSITSLMSWLGFIPYVGWFLYALVIGPLSIALSVFWIIAFIGACRGIEKKAPLVGQINLMNK